MALALNIFLTALAAVVLADLIRGVAIGRLRLLNGDKSANPTTFWIYALVEAILVILVASLWF